MADLYPDVRYESNNAACVLTGTWTTNLSDGSLRNSNKSATTVTTGDFATITSDVPFTDAVIHCYANNDAGMIRVYVDGVVYGDYDCFVFNTNTAANPGYNTPIVCLRNLKKSIHVIKIECLGVSGPSSSGVKVGFNYIYCLTPEYPIERPVPKRVLFIGDSITDSSTGYACTVIPSLADSICASQKVSFRWQTRPGVGSDFARFAENTIIANRPSFVNIMLGTNDFGTAYLVKTIANLQIAIDACKKLNVPCQICTVPPRTSITAFYYIDLNEKIRQLAWTNGVYLVDWKPIFKDTAGTTGVMSGDGVHPSLMGQNMMGKLMFDTMVTNPNHPFTKMLK